MTHSLDDRWSDLSRRVMPWGSLFAKRSNFEWGYFVEEGRLVASYLEPPSDILIIGSGNGREAYPICRNGHKIVCMDIGWMYLVSGQRLFAAEGVQSVYFLQANMVQLPFAGETFDFVFFSLYVPAAENRLGVVRDIWRILRPGGFVLMTAATPEKKRPLKDGEVWVASEQQLRQEISLCSPCSFELLESAVDVVRPEYRFSILRKQGVGKGRNGFGS